MDVKSAFLHGKWSEKVYVMPPERSGIVFNANEALRLRKSLYGLRQSPRYWFEKWSTVMRKLNFSPLRADKCVLYRRNLWLLLYVDDVIIIGQNSSAINGVRNELTAELDMNDLSLIHNLLGITFKRDSWGGWLSQSHYVSTILKNFGMSECKPV